MMTLMTVMTVMTVMMTMMRLTRASMTLVSGRVQLTGGAVCGEGVRWRGDGGYWGGSEQQRCHCN